MTDQTLAPAAARKPNFFDQFDPPAAAPAAARKPNFFDQFDEPAAAPLLDVAGTTDPANTLGIPVFNRSPSQDELAGMRPTTGAKSDLSPMADAAISLPVGVAKGAMGVAGLPGDMQHMSNTVFDRLTTALAHGIQDFTGFGPQAGTPERAEFDKLFGGFSSIVDNSRGTTLPTSAGIKQAVETATGPLYEPKTAAGRYAQTVGEFTPGLLVGPGGIGSKFVGDVLIPAIMSETAGAAASGTSFEPYARMAGGLAGNLGTAAVRARSGAPEAVVTAGMRGVSPDAIEEAKRLQEAAARAGVPLTGPEAMQAATKGGTKFADVMRVVEGSTAGGARTAPFFAARPGQVDERMNALFDAISPREALPSSLGPRAAAAAQRQIDASPEGSALLDAIWRSGPHTTPEAAGAVIQPALAEVLGRREGMRNALADQDFAAARAAPARVDVASLSPGEGLRNPSASYQFNPQTNSFEVRPVPVEPQAPLALAAPDSGGMIQVDPRTIVGHIDNAMATAKGATRSALGDIRAMLGGPGGFDTTVDGLTNARGQIGARIEAAARAGDNPTAAALGRVRDTLDEALAVVPEHAAASANFRAASVPLQPFDRTPALSSAVARDTYGNDFVTPAERVPGAILAGGPSAGRAFAGVATREAADSMDAYLASEFLGRVTNAEGRVDVNRLALTLRDNADVLAQYPNVRQRLQDIVETGNAAAAARTGPLAQMADAMDTGSAADALLPARPMAGGEGELADAATRLASQDPATARALVRQRLANQFDASTGRLVGGENQYGGARFAKDIAGTPQAEANLNAVVSALPDGEALQPAVRDLIEILRATGTRKPQGSSTEFNRQITDEVSAVPMLAGGASSIGTALPRIAGDRIRRAWYGRGANTLADLFLAPDSVERMEAIAAQSGMTPFVDAIMRQMLTGGAQSGIDRYGQ